MLRALASAMQRLHRLDDVQKDVLRYHCLLNSRVHQTGCDGGERRNCKRIARGLKQKHCSNQLLSRDVGAVR